MRHHRDGYPGRRGQARLVDHPREQVLRRELHRAQPEQLSLADAAPAGRAAHPLLRHRPLQHGQLHLAGVRSVPVVRHPGRLRDVGEHDQQRTTGSSPQEPSAREPTPTTPPTAAARTPPLRPRPGRPTATTANSSCTAASTPPSATTAACIPRTFRPCSTSTTRPASRGRHTRRISEALSPSDPATYVTGSTPGVTDTVPGREDGLCGYPGTASNDPVTNPTNRDLARPGSSRASRAPSRPTRTTTASPPTSTSPSTSRPPGSPR